MWIVVKLSKQHIRTFKSLLTFETFKTYPQGLLAVVRNTLTRIIPKTNYDSQLNLIVVIELK